MTTKRECYLLAATLMGLPLVSAAQEATQSKPPSPEVVQERLDSMPEQLPRPTPVAAPSNERIADLPQHCI